MLDPVHVSPWGVYITTPGATATNSKVNIKTNIINESSNPSNVKLVTRIINSNGNEVSKTESQQQININASGEFVQELMVNGPQLWSIDSPVLYTAISEVYRDGKLTDKTETKFGIRTISFDATNGFRLNGRTISFMAVVYIMIMDHLAQRAYDRAEERRVELLKASGFNAIRCSHNPPSPAFLDACDRLGMLVLDEAFDMWRIANNPYDYHLLF